MIVTLGDLLLDVIVRLEQPLAESADANAVTRLGAGGQAANVAAWVAELGGGARFVGKRAGDDAGEVAARALGRLRRRSGRACRGRAHRDRRLPRRHRWRPDDGLRPRGLARPAGGRARARLAGGLRAPAPPRLLAPARTDRRGWPARGRAGASCQRRPLLAGARSATSARRGSASGSRRCGRRSSSRTRTRSGSSAGRCPGAPGSSSAASSAAWFGDVELPALPAEVVDSTGAGDALAAGYLVGGPELALEAAARCVAQLGSMP